MVNSLVREKAVTGDSGPRMHLGLSQSGTWGILRFDGSVAAGSSQSLQRHIDERGCQQFDTVVLDRRVVSRPDEPGRTLLGGRCHDAKAQGAQIFRWAAHQAAHSTLAVEIQ